LNCDINSRHYIHIGKRASLSHLYSSVSREITSFESPKISTASAPASRSSSIPLRMASYSTKLLVHGAVILMEKESVAPRGDTNRIPTPHPSSQADPSNNIAQARINSAAISVLILSATRSASACPLTAFAGWYRISNSDNANIHFPSRPFRTGADSMCFMTPDLHITIVSVESKIWRSFVHVKYKQRQSFSISGYLVSASNMRLLR